MNAEIALCRSREVVVHDPELITLRKFTVEWLKVDELSVKAHKEYNIPKPYFITF